MSQSSQRVTQRSLQSLLLKRFGMAVATYTLTGMLCWIGVFAGLLHVTPVMGLTITGLAALSQLMFLGLFLSGVNLRFADPSLTQAQVLVALAWLTLMLSLFSQGRGSMLVIYLLIMLFGVFQLPPRIFARCALFAFFGFAGLNLYEAYTLQLSEPRVALMQVSVLAVVLIWLCLFSSYTQAMRQRMRQRRFALQAHQDTLRGMMRQLEDLAATDELTGLCNRRHFLRLASRELEDCGMGVSMAWRCSIWIISSESTIPMVTLREIVSCKLSPASPVPVCAMVMWWPATVVRNLCCCYPIPKPISSPPVASACVKPLATPSHWA
jgi:hypothetical protein